MSIPNLKQIIGGIVGLPLRAVASAFPKNKRVWVVSNKLGFNDNAYELAKYIQENHPEIELVWFSDTPKPSPCNTLNIVKRNSLKGITYQLRAKVFLLSTGFSEAGIARPLFGAKYIQLWHGWPIKKILLDEHRYQPKKPFDVKAKASRLALKLSLKQYSLVVCHDIAMKRRFRQCFGLPEERFVVTGWPRFCEHRATHHDHTEQYRRILALPTWHRNDQTLELSLRTLLSDELAEFCRTHRLQIMIKAHPLHRENVYTTVKNHPHVMMASESESTEELILKADVITTDFSSIAIDAEIVYQKPVVLLSGSLERYHQEQGVYEEYLSLYRENGASTTKEFITALDQDTPKFKLTLNQKAARNVVFTVKNLIRL